MWGRAWNGERHPGVTIVTNDTSDQTGLGRTTYRTFAELERIAPFPVRLAVLDRDDRSIRVHEHGEVTEQALWALPEHRYGFFLRASRHVPLGEINVAGNQVLGYLPLPDKVVAIYDLFFRTAEASLAYRLQSHWIYPAMRGALHYTAISESSKQEAVDVLGLDPDRITVVPLGVEAADFESSLSRYEARIKLGLDPDARVLFHASGETRRKNVDGIIRALAFVREREGLEDTVLVKAGRAMRRQDRKRHEGLAKELGLAEAVHFVGEVDARTLARHYRAADVVAFPSLQEGFGLPVLEAMAAGTPCVTSDRSALPEAAGDAAILVDPTDPAAIADGLVRVLTDPSLAKELVERGHRRVAECTWQRTAERFCDVLRTQLERRS